MDLKIAKLSPKLSPFGWDTLYITFKTNIIIKVVLVTSEAHKYFRFVGFK